MDGQRLPLLQCGWTFHSLCLIRHTSMGTNTNKIHKRGWKEMGKGRIWGKAG